MAKKILVIDDEEIILRIIKMRLEASGFEVTTANSGEDGLKLAEENKFDLILCDVMMPGIDGIQTVTRIHANKKTAAIPVIMLTGLSNPRIIAQALDAGVVDYLIKPFDPRDLVGKVIKTLGDR